jgi:hypothetical protein
LTRLVFSENCSHTKQLGCKTFTAPGSAGSGSACPKHAKPDPDKAALKAGIVEILGDDEDGIAAAMEDFGL